MLCTWPYLELILLLNNCTHPILYCSFQDLYTIISNGAVEAEILCWKGSVLLITHLVKYLRALLIGVAFRCTIQTFHLTQTRFFINYHTWGITHYILLMVLQFPIFHQTLCELGFVREQVLLLTIINSIVYYFYYVGLYHLIYCTHSS